MQDLKYNLAGDGLRTQSWLSPACSSASHVKGRSILLCVPFDYDVAMFYQRGVSSFTRSLQAPRKLHKPHAHAHTHTNERRRSTHTRMRAHTHARTNERMHDSHSTTHENTRQFTFMTYTCDDIHCDSGFSVIKSTESESRFHVQAPRACNCTIYISSPQILDLVQFIHLLSSFSCSRCCRMDLE